MKKTFGILIVVALVSQLFLGDYRPDDAQAAPLDNSAAALAVGNIYRVTPGGKTSTPCGGSWTDACELQTALGVAYAGDEIWVAAGRYTPTSGTDPTISFQLKNRVAVYGGFEGIEDSRDQRDSDPATNGTILSGDLLGNDGPDFANYVDNSNHVVIGSGTDSSAVLDGFTISGGYAVWNSNIDGGGMYNDSGSPSLTNLIFSWNTSPQGAGMYNANNSNPVLTQVTFENNFATYTQGGGMFNYFSSPHLRDVTFYQNTADEGPSDPQHSYGGGMYNYSSNPTLVNVSFNTNTSATFGGGMYNSSSNPTLVNVSFNTNTSAGSGGGMGNDYQSSPTLVNTVFSNNAAKGTSFFETAGSGGGMYNDNQSSPTLTNVTLSGNTSIDPGGGMANLSGSQVQITNSIFWDNSGGDVDQSQIYNDSSSSADLNYSLVQSVCPTDADCDLKTIYLDPLFVDPANDDLRLQVTSPAVDAGDTAALPPDTYDLDEDSNTTEPLPFDLDGLPRVIGAGVDIGAYEFGCHLWYMNLADGQLESGQDYRQGFHAELTGDEPVTISETLTEYAAGVAESKFNQAKSYYETALACPNISTSESHQALLGVQNTIWELATGTMLLANEEMVGVLDVTATGGVWDSTAAITQLQEAIDLYNQATDGYLELLSGTYSTEFLASQPNRIDPLTGELRPYVDLQRLAYAAAQKSRAYLELAERYFRTGRTDQAEWTLLKGYFQALTELTQLYSLWPEVLDDTSYTDLLRSLAGMERVYTYLQQGKNPFGYGPEFVPFHYRPNKQVERGDNNYEQTMWLAGDYLDDANTAVSAAQGYQQQIDDNYENLQLSLQSAASQYDDELQELCGDLTAADCASGEIYEQLIVIQGAQLRIEEVLQQMENQNQLIRIEQERAAKVAGIHNATAQLITETGEELASLAQQEVELRDNKSTAGGFLGILSGAFSGATAGASAGGPWGALAGGIIGGALSAADWAVQDDVAGDLAGIAASKERLYAKQKAAVQYAEAEVTLADSEAKVREYFLKFAELEIDYAIAMNNLTQELARLHSLQTRAQYLISQKDKAETFYALLYRDFQDPAARVLRNQLMETAHSLFEKTLDQTYRAGRALEYEINEQAHFSGDPLDDLEDLYPLNDTFFLESAQAQMNIAYEDWHADNPSPQSRTDIIYLSRALGFEDTYDPDLGRTVTREEQFNAFVRGRADPDVLSIDFQTSLFLENKFFNTNLFNDKIISIKMRVRGDELAVGDREPKVVDIRLTQAGTSFIRNGNSRIACGGEDDLREYNLEPLVATIQAAVNETAFPQTNLELATRSVAFTNWTLEIDTSLAGENQYLNLDSIDEIELVIEHEAYTLQCVSTLSLPADPRLFEPPLTRVYQPAELVLAPFSFNHVVINTSTDVSSSQSSSVDLNSTYVGTVQISDPPYLSPIDLVLVLDESNGNLSGYISPSLNISATYQSTLPGPSLSGSWSGDSFSLQSEVFQTNLSAGITIDRQVILESGVISNTGEILSGIYHQTLIGLTTTPLEITGEFEIRRPTRTLEAAFSANPISGPPGLAVQFEDLSSGDPTSWKWDFGDKTTSSAQNPTHIYSKAGSYTVTLTVSNEFDSQQMIRTDFIYIYNPRLFLPLINR